MRIQRETREMRTMAADVVAPDHEQVVYRSDAGTGLRAIIAIHNTKLGPAAGGCRR